MNSLSASPAAELLPRLFEQAEQADQPLRSHFAQLSPLGREQAIERLVREEKDGYVGFYAKLRENYLSISRNLGQLLYALARARKARLIVEFGASFGISAIHCAAALRDNGGGRLITTEMEPEKAARARENLRAAGLEDLVEIRLGDAMESLKTGVPYGIDLVFLDGAKILYLPILKLLEPRLAPGAIILTDNTVAASAYLDYVRNPVNGYASLPLPFEDGNELSVWTA